MFSERPIFPERLIRGCCSGPSAPEAESSFGAPGADAAEVSTGRDVIMGGTAPADADLLDDADTEIAAAAAERSAHQLRPQACHLLRQEAY